MIRRNSDLRVFNLVDRDNIVRILEDYSDPDTAADLIVTELDETAFNFCAMCDYEADD